MQKIRARGKSVVTEMTNLALEANNIDDTVIRLGTNVPTGTTTLLKHRYVCKISKLLLALKDLLCELKDMYDTMENSLHTFEGDFGAHGPLDDPRPDVALFTALTHRQACRLVSSIVAMYEKELEAKTRVVEDLSQACASLFSGKNHGKGFWYVHITAWMSDIFVNRDMVDNILRDIASEGGMPYSGTSL